MVYLHFTRERHDLLLWTVFETSVVQVYKTLYTNINMF